MDAEGKKYKQLAEDAGKLTDVTPEKKKELKDAEDAIRDNISAIETKHKSIVAEATPQQKKVEDLHKQGQDLAAELQGI